MSEIYQRAARVLIWLDNDQSEIFSWMNNVVLKTLKNYKSKYDPWKTYSEELCEKVPTDSHF